MDDIKRYYGLYRGVVSNAKDPNNQRRLKLTVPQVTDSEVTGWAWPFQLSSLTTEIPTQGQGVWVMFIGGDPEFPVWLGEFGKHQDKSKKIYVKTLSNSTSLTGLTPYIKTVTEKDGTTTVDLVATLLAMAAVLKDHESRIHTLETTPDIDPV